MSLERENFVMCRDREFAECRRDARHVPGTGSYASRTLCLFMVCAGAVVVLVGCRGNEGPERVVVSGTVTYQGKPIKQGLIRFIPDANSQVPASGAEIIEGRYRADSHGGVAVGTHRIEIEGYREVSASMRDMPSNFAPPPNYLPGRYNVNSELRITIDPGSGPIVENFDLTG